MSRVLALAAFLIFGLSCTPDPPEADPITFSRDSLAANSELCGVDSTRCVRAEAVIPVAFGGAETVRQRINDTIAHYSALLIGVEDSEEQASDPARAVRMFVEVFGEYLEAAETGFPMGWFSEQSGRVLWQNDSLVSVSIRNYSYTGGAHPNGETCLLSFQLTEGRKLTYSDIISDRQRLMELAQDYFRRSRGLDSDAELFEAGFFWDEAFFLPENFAFTEEGLLLFYNSYEAASYAAGSTEFTIPYAELRGILAHPDWWPVE